MNFRIVRIITIALCAVLLLGATLARPVLADQPVPWSDSDQYTFELANCGGGLTIYDEFTYNLEGNSYLDQDGNWTRDWFHVWATDRLYTNQNDLEIQTAKFTWTGTIEYSDKYDQFTVKAQGHLYKVIIPRYGDLLHSVGQIIHDMDNNILKITPKMDTHFEGDFSELCAYFAGQ
jgi:hypothetical protein